MTDVFASVGPLLVQSGKAVHDSTIFVLRPEARSLVDQITAWATAIITITLLVLAVVAVPALWRFRRTYRRVDHLIERIYGDVNPIAHNVRDITDNINFITTAIRPDVEKVTATIDEANQRVQLAMTQTERRVKDFNALLVVVQEEAEHLFLSTASTVRGVKRGAEAFGERSGMEFASDELDPAYVAENLALQEEGDGHDRSTQSAAEALTAAPRVRPRPGTRRRS